MLLFLLAGCLQSPTGNVIADLEISEPGIVAEKAVEPAVPSEAKLVQCPDGSFVGSVQQCGVQVKEIETVARSLLLQSRDKFSSYAYVVDDSLVINYGNQTRYMFNRLTKAGEILITDVYVNKDNHTAVAFCNIDREARLSDTSFDFERSKCRHYLDVPIVVSFEKWNPKGPLEFLEEFENKTPFLYENSTLTMSIGGNSKTIQPSLHYDVNGARVVLRIDRRYLVPARIEFENSTPIDFRDTYFDLMVVEGKQQRITRDWVVYQNISSYWLNNKTK